MSEDEFNFNIDSLGQSTPVEEPESTPKPSKKSHEREHTRRESRAENRIIEVPTPIENIISNGISWEQVRMIRWDEYLSYAYSYLRYPSMSIRRRKAELINQYFGLPIFSSIRQLERFKQMKAEWPPILPEPEES